jgi:hypothetical protein
MKVNLTSSNPALESIFKNPNQIITLDANFLIPPDRSKYANASFNFSTFQRIWLDPIFEAFPNLAIHEAVYAELITPSLKAYIDEHIKNKSKKFSVHTDSSLTPVEHYLRDSIEDRIYPLTNYDPNIDNKDDRGEVKSLAFIAVKGLPYFAAHDSNSIKLIELAEEWSTGLDNIQAVKIYELIYYLYKKDNNDKKSLKMLYKYYYYLTPHEKNINPEWGKFIEAMEALYPLT